MNCSQAQDRMMKFFDRDINDIEEAQLKNHLKTCKACSQEFKSLKEIFADIEQLPEIEPPEHFEQQVMNRIEKEVPIYRKPHADNEYVLNILLTAVSFTFVIIFGGLLWDAFKQPIDLVQQVHIISQMAQQFLSAALSTAKGMAIAIVGVTLSLYKTYYYAYIVLGILLLMLQKAFITVLRGNNGRA